MIDTEEPQSVADQIRALRQGQQPSVADMIRSLRQGQQPSVADMIRSLRSPSQRDQTVEDLPHRDPATPPRDEDETPAPPPATAPRMRAARGGLGRFGEGEAQEPRPVAPAPAIAPGSRGVLVPGPNGTTINAVGVPTEPRGIPEPAPETTAPEVADAMAKEQQAATAAAVNRGGFFTAAGRAMEVGSREAFDTIVKQLRDIGYSVADAARIASEGGDLSQAAAQAPFNKTAEHLYSTKVMGMTPEEQEIAGGEAAGLEDKHAVASVIGGLGAMPVQMLEPKAIAAMIIAHAPTEALAASPVIAKMLDAVAEKVGPAIAGQAESLLHSMVGLGNFSAVHKAMDQGATPLDVVKAWGVGAEQGAIFHGVGAAAGLAGRMVIDPIKEVQAKRYAAMVLDRGEVVDAADAARRDAMQAGTNVDRPGLDPKRERAEAERQVATKANLTAVQAMSNDQLDELARQVRAAKGVSMNVRNAWRTIIADEQAAREGGNGKQTDWTGMQRPQGPATSSSTPPQASEPESPSPLATAPRVEPKEPGASTAIPDRPARPSDNQGQPAAPASSRQVETEVPSPESTTPEPTDADAARPVPAAPAQEPPAAEQAGPEGVAAGQPAAAPVRQAVQAGEDEAPPVAVDHTKQFKDATEIPEPPKRWWRGTREGQRGGDTFYSSDKGVAKDYANADGKEAGRVEAHRPEPGRVFTATDKDDLRDEWGIKTDPHAFEFDDAARAEAQKRGYDAIRYTTGTFDADELHVFTKDIADKQPATKAKVTGSTEAQIRAVKARAEAKASAAEKAAQQERRVATRQREGRNPPEFRKGDVERKIIEHATKNPPPDSVLDQQVQVGADGETARVEDIWNGTFKGVWDPKKKEYTLPGEITNSSLDLEGADANLRPFLKVKEGENARRDHAKESSTRKRDAGGEDAFSILEGHRPGLYFDALREIAARKGKPGLAGSKANLAKIAGQDPHAKFLLWLHDRLTNRIDPATRPDWEVRPTAEIPEGAKLHIAGEEFTASKSEWGGVTLKDGVEIDAGATEKVPVDKGTLEPPKGKDAAQAAQEARRAARVDNGLRAKIRKMDADEWEEWRAKNPEQAFRVNLLLEKENGEVPEFKPDDIPDDDSDGGAGPAGVGAPLPGQGPEGEGGAAGGHEGVGEQDVGRGGPEAEAVDFSHEDSLETRGNEEEKRTRTTERPQEEGANELPESGDRNRSPVRAQGDHGEDVGKAAFKQGSRPPQERERTGQQTGKFGTDKSIGARPSPRETDTKGSPAVHVADAKGHDVPLEAPAIRSQETGLHGEHTEGLTGRQVGLLSGKPEAPEPVPPTAAMAERYPGIRSGESPAQYEKRMGTADTPALPGIDKPTKRSQRLKAKADEVAKRMDERQIPRGKNAGAALPPEHLADAAQWLVLKMGEYTLRGIEATATLARRLVDEFRPDLSPHFAQVYGEALRLRTEHDSAVERGEEPPQTPTAAPTGRTPSADVAGPANAITDARRAELGLPERGTPSGRSFEDMLNAGQRLKTGDANAGPALMKRLGKDKGYVIGPDEQGLLTLHMVDRENELTRRIEAVEAAAKTGDPSQVRQARLMLADHVDTMGEEFDLINRAGTAAGRALVSRKLLADMNYSLVSYAAKIQGDIGRALTPEELTSVKKECDAYKQRAAELEAAENGLHERLAEAESVAHFAEAQRQAAEQGRIEAEAGRREAEKNAVPSYLKERFEKWKAKAKKAADDSDEWLKKNFTLASTVPSAEQVYHLTRWSVGRLTEKALTLAEFTTEAVARFGDKITPHVHTMYWAAEKELKNQLKGIGLEPDEVVKKVRKPKDGTVQPVKPKSTMDKLRARAAEGTPITELQRYLRARELEMIREGADTREKALEGLHNEVRAVPEFKDVTREEVRDLLSGYGEFRELDPEAAKKTQRQWRQEHTKLGQLRDLNEGKLPKATGVERESPSDTARRLQAEVNEAKKQAGLDPNAGPGSLKTLVQTQTTRLKNRIADIKTELDTGTRIVNRRPVKISTPEIESLRKELEVLEAAHKAMFKKPDPTDAELLEAAVNAAKQHADLWAQKVKDAKAGKFRDEGTKKQFKDPRIDAFQAQADALREEHQALKDADPKEQARKAAALESSATKAAQRAYEKALSDLSDAQAGKFKAPPGKGRLTPTIESLRRQTDALRERYQALKAADPAQQRVMQDRLNQQYRAQIARKMADNADRIARGDLKPRVNARKLIDDKETRVARMKYEDQVRTMNQLRDRMREQNKGWLSKALDWVPGQSVQWSVLTWPTTIVKLASAAASRMAFTPIEQGFGLLASKAMPDLARYAPRHGAPSARTLLAAEGDSLIGFATGARDARFLLKGQATPLMRTLGKERLPPLKRDWIRYALHASIKNPILESEFRRSLTLRVDHAIKNGVDTTDPFERHRLMSESYQDAKRALFLQDNAMVSAFQGFLARAAKTADRAGHETAASLLGRWAQAELPIVKIPTNLVAEALEHIFGLAVGGGRAAYWYSKGIENLKDQPIVADAILRQLKKGSVGAAVGLLGLAYYNHAGGFHVKGVKQEEDEGKVGEIAGIPAALLHSPQAEVFQFYATVRKMLNRQIKKTSGEDYGLTTAAIASFMGLIGDTPFVKEMGLFDQIEDPKTANDALAKDWLGKTIPGLVQFPAAYFDREPHPPGFWGWYNAERVHRDPHGWTETAESMVPGLRERVPTKEENAAAGKAQERYYRQSRPAARKK